jgi:hypothetical protein
MLNHGLNHGYFLSLFNFTPCPIPGIYRWSIILADTDFFQQSKSVSAADFRGRLNRPSTFYQIICSFLAPDRFGAILT